MALDKYIDLERLAKFKENLDAIFATKKDKQTVVRDPVADGNSVSFIDSISQDSQGVISPTKKTIGMATISQSGLMSPTDKIKVDNLIVSTLDSTIRITDDTTGFIIQLNATPVSAGIINVFEDVDGLAFTFVS